MTSPSDTYYSRNKEKILEYQREYRTRPDYNKNALAYEKQRRRKNPERALWESCKKRAGRQGLDFNIEISDIVIPELCPILLKPMVSFGPDRSYWPSVDRIDNDKGYVKGNVAVISRKANAAKSDMSLDTVRRLLEYMEETKCLDQPS